MLPRFLNYDSLNTGCLWGRKAELFLPVLPATRGFTTFRDLTGKHHSSALPAGAWARPIRRGGYGSTLGTYTLSNPGNLIRADADMTFAAWFMRTSNVDHTFFLIQTHSGAVPAFRVKSEGTGGSGIDRFNFRLEDG